jgi:hypothetical protein
MPKRTPPTPPHTPSLLPPLPSQITRHRRNCQP